MASEINFSDNEAVETVHDPHHPQDATHIRKQIAEIENRMENLDLGNLSDTDEQKELGSDQVREHFESQQGENGTEWAICKYCRKKLVGSINIGTKHLQNHFERCATKRNIGGRDGDHKPAEVGNWLTNPNIPVMLESSVDAARMIIKNGNTSSLALIEADDIIQVYEEEKERLGTHLKNLPCRLHLSILEYGRYFLFKIHFIDDDWEMKEKVISVKRIEEDSSILKCLKDVLLEWGIDRNVSFINFRRYEYMVDAAEYVMSFNEIRSWFIDRGSLLFAGKLLFIDSLDDLESENCRLRNGLICDVPGKICRILYYVRETSSNEQNFQIAIERAVSLGRVVTAEVIPDEEDARYYEPKECLEIAIGYKEAFFELENIDTEFKSINLTTEQWDQALALNNCFEELFHNEFDYWRCNTTVTMRFVLLCELYTRSLLLSKFHFLFGNKEIFNRFRNVMNEYWSKSNLVLAATAVLDPRFNVDIVEYWYKKIYGSEWETQLTLFIEYFTNVYNEYARLDSSGKQLYDSLTSYTKLHPSWRLLFPHTRKDGS